MDLPLKVSDCSISMVEELLSGLNDWRGSADIIRLTIKALTEVVKTQSLSISQLNRHVAALPDREMVEEISLKLENGVKQGESFEFEAKLSEKVSKKELIAVISNKVSVEQLNDKVNAEEFYNECKQNHMKIEKIQNELNRKISDLGLSAEFQRIHMEITEKPSWKEVQELLDKKIERDFVLNVVNQKVGRKEVEEMIKGKADFGEISGVLAKLEGRVERHYFDQQILGVNEKFKELSAKFEELSDRATEERLVEVNEKLLEVQKLLKTEVDNIKKNITASLNKKANYDEVENLYDIVKQKIEFNEVKELYEKMGKEHQQTVTELRRDLKLDIKRQATPIETFSRLDEDLSKIKKQLIEVLEDRKKDTIEHAQFLKTATTELKRELRVDLSKLSETLDTFKDAAEDSFVRKHELASLKNDLKLISDQKYSKEEFSTFFLTSFQEVSKAIKDLKKSQKPQKSAPKSEAKPSEPLKPNYSDAILSKADRIDLESAVSSIHSLHSDLTALKSQQCSDSSFLLTHISSTKSLIESLQTELKLKPNTKEILALIDNKANIDDINKALIEIHKELDAKIDSDAVTRGLTSCETSLLSLWPGNSYGRWHWKSGELRHGNLLPWEAQITNTVPDVFMWEKEKTSVVVMVSGVYLVNLAVVGKKKIRVQVNVNGESLLDTGNKANIASNRVFYEYLTLPARARVSVTFFGENPVQGILELIKYS